MLTLLGSLLGFLGSFAPSMLKFLKDRADHVHELKILDKQIEVLKIQHSHHLEEIKILADIAEVKALYDYPRSLGIGWVDALSGSVRPTLTYGFFILYCTVKISQVIHLWPIVHKSLSLALVSHIWHEEDQALFAAVMSFWFGQRALSKVKK